MHSHDHPEISIIFSDTAKYTIHNRTYTLNAGELILFAPGTAHSVLIPKQTHYHDLHLGISHLIGQIAESSTHFTDGFLIQTRLSIAKNLLETQEIPIKEVSRQVGYEDAYHFSKLFKKYYGYPPSSVKKIKQASHH